MKANSDTLEAYYKTYLQDLHDALTARVVTDIDQNAIPHEEGLLQWCRMCHDAKTAGQTMYFVGNGASATMASHMAADFSKNCGCRAMAFNDVALMTAVSNDTHYEECFTVPLLRFANPDDLLVTISSSGNPPQYPEGHRKRARVGYHCGDHFRDAGGQPLP